MLRVVSYSITSWPINGWRSQRLATSSTKSSLEWSTCISWRSSIGIWSLRICFWPMINISKLLILAWAIHTKMVRHSRQPVAPHATQLLRWLQASAILDPKLTSGAVVSSFMRLFVDTCLLKIQIQPICTKRSLVENSRFQSSWVPMHKTFCRKCWIQTQKSASRFQTLGSTHGIPK